MKNMLLILAASGALLLPQAAQAKIRLPPGIIGPNMVVQPRSQAPLWGWARPGSAVSVTPSGDKKPSSRRPTRGAIGG